MKATDILVDWISTPGPSSLYLPGREKLGSCKVSCTSWCQGKCPHRDSLGESMGKNIKPSCQRWDFWMLWLIILKNDCPARASGIQFLATNFLRESRKQKKCQAKVLAGKFLNKNYSSSTKSREAQHNLPLFKPRAKGTKHYCLTRRPA